MPFPALPIRENILRLLLGQGAEQARRLHRQGLAPGREQSLSFAFEGRVYITRRCCDFAVATEEDFSCVTFSGKPLNNLRAPEEAPLHLALYRHRDDISAAVHVHSTMATLWSCLEAPDPADALPAYTPHAARELGRIPLIPYAPPGSAAFFEGFRAGLGTSKAYLLQNHGLVVCGSDIASACLGVELIEQAALLAWMLRGEKGGRMIPTQGLEVM